MDYYETRLVSDLRPSAHISNLLLRPTPLLSPPPSLPSAQTPSPVALEKLQDNIDSLDNALANISSLSKSSPVLDPLVSSPSSVVSSEPPSQEKKPVLKRRSSFTKRIMSLFSKKEEEVDQDIDLTRGPSTLNSMAKKDTSKRLSFSGKSAMANVSSAKGIDLSNGAMEFGADTPIEVLAALASLHKDEGEEGGDADISLEERRKKRRARRRRSI